MATESIGSLIPTAIPGYEDSADIQAALRAYHYGSYSYDTANTSPASLITPSIAKTIYDLQQADLNFVTLNGTQTLTNKTLTSPTVSGLYISDASIAIEGATTNTFKTTLTVTDPTANNTITFGDTSGTVVLDTQSQTLTNKTLTSPTISTISGNTTINVAATNTAAVLWNTTLTTGSISTGGSLTTGGVNIANGTTFAGTVAIANASTSAHTVSVSNGAGVANKTINIGTASTGGTTNITIGSNSGATSNVTIHGLTASSIKNTGTLTLPTSTDTLVGRATTDTLTNKTLSSAILTGTLTAGGGVGTSGQVLTSTGTGVQWSTTAAGYSQPTIGSTPITSGATVTTIAGLTLSSAIATTAFTLNGTAELRLADTDSSNYIGFKAPGTIGTNLVWTLPSTDGSSGQFLSTDGSGTLSWATASGGGGTASLADIFMLAGM